MGWEALERSNQYRTRARSAELRARKYRTVVTKSDTYRRLHDEALAEFCVLDELVRTGIRETPGQVLVTLYAMKDAPTKGEEPQPFDKTVFDSARRREIGLLIKRLEVETR